MSFNRLMQKFETEISVTEYSQYFPAQNNDCRLQTELRPVYSYKKEFYNNI